MSARKFFGLCTRLGAPLSGQTAAGKFHTTAGVSITQPQLIAPVGQDIWSYTFNLSVDPTVAPGGAGYVELRAQMGRVAVRAA